MDLTAILGALILALASFYAASGYTADLVDGTLLLLVVAGGFGVALLASRAGDVVTLIRLPFIGLFGKTPDSQSLVARVVGYAETARRLGILALEPPAMKEPSAFMQTGMRLTVDGTEPKLVRSILETELTHIEARHNRGHDLMRILVASWTGMGLLSALGILGLRTGYIGRVAAIEEASLALVYGGVLGLVTLALRWRLQTLSNAELEDKRMMIEGMLSIQAGDNPRIIQQKLAVFLPPSLRDIPSPPPIEVEPVPDEPAPDAEFQSQVQDVIAKLRSALPEELKEEPDAWTLKDLLALTEQDARREILASIGESEPPPEFPPYDFEALSPLSDREIQMFLREANTKDLSIALKGASQEVRDRIFANVSERVGRMIKNEIRSKRVQSAPVRQVVDVQLRLLRVLQRLKG